MKTTTKKLLLWLYSLDSMENRMVSSVKLRLILPELKKSGYRSLLNLLKNQHYIFTESSQASFDVAEDLGIMIGLTSHGRNALEAQFPVLKTIVTPFVGDWSLITFIEAPSSDKQFRYLRQFLLNSHCGQLARGAYLYPGALPVEVMNTLNKLYVGKVVVTGLKSWNFGDERSTIDAVFHLSDLKSGYSGISKEVHSMLRKSNGQKSIENRDKTSIHMVFDRLVELLSQDLGLLLYYSPDVRSGLDLLSQIQDLL